MKNGLGPAGFHRYCAIISDEGCQLTAITVLRASRYAPALRLCLPRLSLRPPLHCGPAKAGSYIAGCPSGQSWPLWQSLASSPVHHTHMIPRAEDNLRYAQQISCVVKDHIFVQLLCGRNGVLIKLAWDARGIGLP